MEEYKKPEFSVRMDAPAKPIRLGQPIPVAIQADYYAGGPVSGGKATITITRTLGANIWTPYWNGAGCTTGLSARTTFPFSRMRL